MSLNPFAEPFESDHQTVVERRGQQVVLRKFGSSPAARHRLAHEAAILARAQRPGVVELVDHHDDGQEATLVTAWVGTHTLATMTVRSLDQVAGLVAVLADTVEALHLLGIIHGRITPDHVVLDAQGYPVLVGFGDAAMDGDRDKRHERSDDAAGLGRLLMHLLHALPRGGAFGSRKERRQRDALDSLAAQAVAENPWSRPSAHRLAAGILAAVPGARPADTVQADAPPVAPAAPVAIDAHPPTGDRSPTGPPPAASTPPPTLTFDAPPPAGAADPPVPAAAGPAVPEPAADAEIPPAWRLDVATTARYGPNRQRSDPASIHAPVAEPHPPVPAWDPEPPDDPTVPRPGAPAGPSMPNATVQIDPRRRPRPPAPAEPEPAPANPRQRARRARLLGLSAALVCVVVAAAGAAIAFTWDPEPGLTTVGPDPTVATTVAAAAPTSVAPTSASPTTAAGAMTVITKGGVVHEGRRYGDEKIEPDDEMTVGDFRCSRVPLVVMLRPRTGSVFASTVPTTGQLRMVNVTRLPAGSHLLPSRVNQNGCAEGLSALLPDGARTGIILPEELGAPTTTRQAGPS